MALLTTYGKRNRVITQELMTTYERELVAKEDSDVGAAYWSYTRTRTKKYEYIGLSHDAAVRAAEDLNRLYCRKYFDWEWVESERVWHMVAKPDQYSRRRRCGTATPTHVSGGVWRVDVQVEEVLTIPYRESPDRPAEEPPVVWQAFEQDPDMRTNFFKGFADQERMDFDYDEGDGEL